MYGHLRLLLVQLALFLLFIPAEMILLLTTDGDVSVDVVIDWLNYFQHPFIRLNSINLIRKDFILEIRHDQVYLTVAEQKINLADVRAVWYRKFGFFTHSEEYLEATNHVQPDALAQLVREFVVVQDTVLSLLRTKRWLTDPRYATVNKPYCMLVAAQCGLSIPDTYLLNSKEALAATVGQHAVISKSVKDGYLFNRAQGGSFSMFTTAVETADLSMLADRFLPSLVQQQIEKEYELRVFYLMGRCYAMAIFSQRDRQTQLDFRNYNHDRPNRTVPYRLPPELRRSIHHLMRRMGLNCGSLDFMKGIDGKYYFLEINSTGQFGMVDFPCNYGLHRKVAETLISFDK